MPRVVSLVTGVAIEGLSAAATKTFMTPLRGARKLMCRPSGLISTDERAELPKTSRRGMTGGGEVWALDWPDFAAAVWPWCAHPGASDRAGTSANRSANAGARRKVTGRKFRRMSEFLRSPAPIRSRRILHYLPISHKLLSRRLKQPGGVADVTRMSSLKNIASKLLRDERGGEVLEYALIAGLIVVAAIAVIGSVGTKVLARWQSVNASV